MLANGYALTTASHGNGANKLVERAIVEVAEELRLADITPDLVAADLQDLRQKAIEKGDISSAVRTAELKGKMIGAFIERQEVSQVENPENQFLLSRLARLKQANTN